MAQLAITGQDVHLMVDDAEQLQDNALEVLLLRLPGTNEGRLHVFLFSEPPLLPRLEVFSEGGASFLPFTIHDRDYLARVWGRAGHQCL